MRTRDDAAPPQAEDMYLFDAFHTSGQNTPRRPALQSLYDVFACIRDDEAQHSATLRALVESGKVSSALRAQPPSEEEV